MTDIENCQKGKLTIDLGWANVFAFQSVFFLKKSIGIRFWEPDLSCCCSSRN